MLYPCMPDFIMGRPDHPGSPCLIEPGHYAGDTYVPEVRGQWMSEMCLTCGATSRPEPWWMNPERAWGWKRALEPGKDRA